MRGRVAVKILACQGCLGPKTGMLDLPQTCGHSLEAISEAVRRIGNTAALLRRSRASEAQHLRPPSGQPEGVPALKGDNYV